MTKKHFKLVADAIIQEAALHATTTPDWVWTALIVVFRQENGRFDEARFMTYVRSREDALAEPAF